MADQERDEAAPMLTSFYCTPEGTLKQNLDEDAMRTAVRSGQGLLWVDLSKPTPDETFILDDVFASTR